MIMFCYRGFAFNRNDKQTLHIEICNVNKLRSNNALIILLYWLVVQFKQRYRFVPGLVNPRKNYIQLQIT